MTNHYHLLVETPEPTLSKGMQKLDGDFARHFNKVHNRVGHLFEGRFKSKPVNDETHLLETSRYIILNPVRAGMVDLPDEWPWSSYLATAGLIGAPGWLRVDILLDSFNPLDRTAAQELYRTFVSDGMKLPPLLEQVRGCVASEISASTQAKEAFALLAKTDALMTLTQVGTALGMSAAGARFLIQKAERRRERDSRFAEQLSKIRFKLGSDPLLK